MSGPTHWVKSLRAKPGASAGLGRAGQVLTCEPGTPSQQAPSPMELLRAVSGSSDHHTVPQKGPQVPVKGSVFLTKERKVPVREPCPSQLPAEVLLPAPRQDYPH